MKESLLSLLFGVVWFGLAVRGEVGGGGRKGWWCGRELGMVGNGS